MTLIDAVERARTRARADLERLIAIPSVSAEPAHDADVEAAAHAVAELFTEIGSPDVKIVTEGGKPAVIAHFPGPENTPTVGLYAHYDVVPTGPSDQWTSDPFDPTVRGERLYARGAADDKGGLAVHLAALRAFDGKPPVGVTCIVEGEEEIGSPSLADIFAAHADDLATDIFVIADSGNWAVGRPSFTTSLRGMADLTVEVRTSEHGVHSGQYGGPAPDALTALCRLLATLHDEAGNVAVEGFVEADAGDLEYPEAEFRAEAGLLDGVELIGTGSIAQRIWFKPAISVIGIDTTPIDKATNTLIPSARAKLSIRLAPGDTGAEALARVHQHLLANAPWGARVTVTEGESGEPALLPLPDHIAAAADKAFTEAYGVEPVRMGMGGSIPLAQAYQQLYPDSTVLVTAVVDPDSRIHGIDESLHLGDWEKACLAETLLLAELGAGR
ncbi:dipeptidase [Enemella sp. A6]|uniref:dipeptidase n=1 Tax=Enemella sp. A6 TaxID=3440152 RepID=UPI003EB8CEE3